MAIEIAGYPGEQVGQPFTHTGVIIDITKTALGGYVLWHNVDCSGGNSGSAIMITDEEWIKKYSFNKNVKKVIIGVHTGHDPLERLNFGTLITPSLHKWILSGGVDEGGQADDEKVHEFAKVEKAMGNSKTL